jgi:hypothetical protein
LGNLPLIVPALEVYILPHNASCPVSFNFCLAHQPISHLPNSVLEIAAMDFDIAASKVRKRGLVTVWFLLKNEDAFLFSSVSKILSTTIVYAKLKWHVKPIVFTFLACLSTAQVMDGKLACFNEPANFVEAVLSPVISLCRDPWRKAKINYAEQDGLQNRRVFFVKRAVDEYRTLKRWFWHISPLRRVGI